METIKGAPVLSFATADEWERWLEQHYTLQTGVWIKMARKDSGIQTISYADALDTALCYGWIDGLVRSLDDTHYVRKFTPRRPRSLWSKINIGKVAALQAAGRMHATGMAEVEAAKADGRWQAAYESQKNATVPPDLKALLAANPKARAHFEALTKAARYSLLWQLMTARTAATRDVRLQKIIVTLGADEPH